MLKLTLLALLILLLAIAGCEQDPGAIATSEAKLAEEAAATAVTAMYAEGIDSYTYDMLSVLESCIGVLDGTFRRKSAETFDLVYTDLRDMQSNVANGLTPQNSKRLLR